ncbi:chaperonin 10-like protein [Aspergillus insuetus]
MPALRSPTDAVVKMLNTSICGTDLHILKGDVPNMEPGLVLGHEGIGNVEALGSAVTNLFVDDSALISCITCCVVSGWPLGNVINGTQAEYVRIHHASSSLHKLPTNIDAEAAVTFSDALPTGYKCGSIIANVQNGTKVAIIGAGPVGLSAMLTAKLYTQSLTVVIDKVHSRLQHATRLGAEEVVNPASGDAMERLDALSGEHGFASVIKGVVYPETFELCQRIVAPGGSIANIGSCLAIRTRLVDTVTIPILLRLYHARKINPSELVTHKFRFLDILKAYEILQKPSRGILKVGIDF